MIGIQTHHAGKNKRVCSTGHTLLYCIRSSLYLLHVRFRRGICVGIDHGDNHTQGDQYQQPIDDLTQNLPALDGGKARTLETLRIVQMSFLLAAVVVMVVVLAR